MYYFLLSKSILQHFLLDRFSRLEQSQDNDTVWIMRWFRLGGCGFGAWFVVDVLRSNVGCVASIHLCSSELTMVFSYIHINVDICGVVGGHIWYDKFDKFI